MNVGLKRRLHLMWLALRKPYLFGPAVTINRAIINGEAVCEVTIGSDSGEITREYRLVATIIKEK